MSQKYTVARITREGERFEILVKPDPAFEYRLGKRHSVSEVLEQKQYLQTQIRGSEHQKKS